MLAFRGLNDLSIANAFLLTAFSGSATRICSIRLVGEAATLFLSSTYTKD